MDWSSTLATGGTSALIIGVLYGIVKLCQHRRVVCASGCCRCSVSDGDTPIGFKSLEAKSPEPPKPSE